MSDTADELASEIIEATEASADIRDALVKISEAGEALLKSGLTGRAIVVLIKDQTGLPMGDIRAVLRALPQLRQYVND